MTQQGNLEREGRTVPYIDEGEGPVSLVLITDRELESDGLGVISHYLIEEAGFHVVRIRVNAEQSALSGASEDILAVLDELGLADTWVGGHGFGGTVARSFASEHTSRVNGLLLLGVEDQQIALAPAIPVLIIQGADDETTPAANGERLRATAPERASVTNIDGAGHLFPMTHPIETAVAIEEYLDWD